MKHSILHEMELIGMVSTLWRNRLLHFDCKDIVAQIVLHNTMLNIVGAKAYNHTLLAKLTELKQTT